MLTEKDLTKICQEICAGAGYEFTIPVKINKRLTRTLGRVISIRRNNEIYSTSMEFSYQLLTTATYESIIAVVKHECAHYLVNEETREHHGHDSVFKAMCARIGCTNDTTVCTTIERTIEDTEIYKYFIKCKKCGKIIGKYHRAGKIVQNPNAYTHKCGGDLEVIKNFQEI